MKEEVPVFSDSTPVQSRTFSDASPYLTPKSEYTPKIEPVTSLYSKSSSEMPYNPFLENSPIQSPMSFRVDIPTTSPFDSSFARAAFNNKKSGYDSDNESEASDVTPLPVIPM